MTIDRQRIDSFTAPANRWEHGHEIEADYIGLPSSVALNRS